MELETKVCQRMREHCSVRANFPLFQPTLYCAEDGPRELPRLLEARVYILQWPSIDPAKKQAKPDEPMRLKKISSQDDRDEMGDFPIHILIRTEGKT